VKLLVLAGRGATVAGRTGPDVGTLVEEMLLHPDLHAGERTNRLGDPPLGQIVDVVWNGDRRQNADDRDDAHHLDQGESGIRFHVVGQSCLNGEQGSKLPKGMLETTACKPPNLRPNLRVETWGVSGADGQSTDFAQSPQQPLGHASPALQQGSTDDRNPGLATDRAPPGKLLTLSNGNAIAEFSLSLAP
jgi:hypothetical protein